MNNLQLEKEIQDIEQKILSKEQALLKLMTEEKELKIQSEIVELKGKLMDLKTQYEHIEESNEFANSGSVNANNNSYKKGGLLYRIEHIFTVENNSTQKDELLETSKSKQKPTILAVLEDTKTDIKIMETASEYSKYLGYDIQALYIMPNSKDLGKKIEHPVFSNPNLHMLVFGCGKKFNGGLDCSLQSRQETLKSDRNLIIIENFINNFNYKNCSCEILQFSGNPDNLEREGADQIISYASKISAKKIIIGNGKKPEYIEYNPIGSFGQEVLRKSSIETQIINN